MKGTRRTLFRRTARAAAGLLAAVALAATPLDLPAQEVVDAGRPIAPDASIKVWNGGGSVVVRGWTADSLAVTGEVADVAGGRFFLRAEGDVAKLGVEGDQAEVRGRLVVRLPAGATVWIRTGTADVAVRGLTGSVDVSTAAGDVEASGRPETFHAESMGGELDLRLDAGIVRARSGTGRVAFEGASRDLTLRTVSGALEVTAPRLRRGRFSTVDGDVAFTGAIRPAGALAVETHSGDVTLRLPADLAADFRISTFRGSIEAFYPHAPEAEEGPGRRSVAFETGAGGSEVEVRSYSGSVQVLRWR